ncbi:MAG: cadherin-like beta sandwich domain-containing protein [Verrucomicrobiales bacterium]|nr:cadherin-like beta sandwich domain-containing protein [Verrucomicrobiales bacterium]
MKYALSLLLFSLIWACTLTSHAATGSAETGNVTVDTRSDNADLTSLTISSGTLSPDFAGGTISYTASVTNATSSLTITPTVAEANATIDVRVNEGAFAPVTSGAASGSLVLNVGANSVEVRVTAEDGTTLKTYTLTVTRDKASQTITFANPGDQPATATVNLSATGGASGIPVTFAVTSGPASLSGGNVLTFIGAGSVTITASQAGNSDYHDATPVARTFTVSLVPQTITFDSPGARFISEVLTLAASGGGSGSGLTYEVLDGPGVLANGNELSFTGGGDVTVRASQAGDDFHAAADPVEHTFEVILPRPDVAVGPSPSALVGLEVYTPGGQLVTLTSKKAGPVTGHVALGNRVVLPDDRAADSVVLRGSAGNALFAVTYLGNEGNVTAGILTGTYETAAMDGDDGSVLLRAVVTPNKKKLAKKKGRRTVYLKKTFTSLFQANSKAWPAATDAAAINVQTR